MKKRKAKNKVRSKYGITLIALIITVVIMLILAGVAISAVVSGDGLFDRTRYAAELQNFTQMQEAIQLYYYTVTDGTLPVSRNVSVEELESNQNLKTEIGYYRVFLQTGERPILPQDFSGDFMETPSGIADLYYLDNEKLNANTNKQYIYDTVTGEIYLIGGVKVKGETAYSESGMREIMNENYVPDYIENVTMPPSPEPGTGAGYDYRLADLVNTSSNLYKIYNNGDVYAIGAKGFGLNTPKEEMEELRTDKWTSIDFNNIVNGFSKVFVGSQTYRYSQAFLTNSGDVYVSGQNGHIINNKFGLTNEVLARYNENGLNKLEFPYGKVKKMFIGDNTTFIITEDNKLYACGLNINGQLGIGNYENTTTYQEIKGITDIEAIEYIHTYNTNYTIIEKSDNTFYFSGINEANAIGDGRSNKYQTNTFEPIWNQGEFDIDQDIEKIISNGSADGITVLKKDGTILIANSVNTVMQLTDFIGTDKTKFRKLKDEVGSNITDIKSFYNRGLIIEQTINGVQKYYGYSNERSECLGIGKKDYTVDERKLYEIILPEELISEGVKAFNSVYGRCGVIFISNAGNVYYCGEASYSGIDGKTGIIEKVTKLPISNIEGFYETQIDYGLSYPYLQGNDGKVYTIGKPINLLNTGSSSYTFKKILSNIKDVAIASDKIAYISEDNNLYVAGYNKKELGLSTSDTGQQYQCVKIENPNIVGNVEKVFLNVEVWVLTKDRKIYTVKDGEYIHFLSDIEGMYYVRGTHIAYNQNKVWVWQDGQDITEIDLSAISPELVNNVYDVKVSEKGYYILTKDGQIWSKGSGDRSGTGKTHSNFTQIPQSSFNNKKIVKVVTLGEAIPVVIALTEDGKLYGWGADKSLLGLGETTSEVQATPILLPIDNVKDIIAMQKGFIAVKENGEVWATGNNASGIFGRWISSDARYAETINQTAYEWVRCPALEK